MAGGLPGLLQASRYQEEEEENLTLFSANCCSMYSDTLSQILRTSEKQEQDKSGCEPVGLPPLSTIPATELTDPAVVEHMAEGRAQPGLQSPALG